MGERRTAAAGQKVCDPPPPLCSVGPQIVTPEKEHLLRLAVMLPSM